jgi:hypothetical protein
VLESGGSAPADDVLIERRGVSRVDDVTDINRYDDESERT